jgi:hypothetical protein
MTGNNDFIEQQIIEAVKKLLSKRVNELLGNMQYPIPIIEFTDYRGGTVITPAISLSTCECSEKERIIRQDAYSVTITFSLPETSDSEFHCYAYATALYKAMGENPTLYGVADRAVVTGKKYVPPKKPNCGENWEVIVTLRVVIEGKC